MMHVSRVTCPRCGQVCYEFPGHILSEHKTDRVVPGQRDGHRVRERCVYAGGTYADAAAHITPQHRKIIDEQGSHW